MMESRVMKSVEVSKSPAGRITSLCAEHAYQHSRSMLEDIGDPLKQFLLLKVWIGQDDGGNLVPLTQGEAKQVKKDKKRKGMGEDDVGIAAMKPKKDKDHKEKKEKASKKAKQ